MTPESIITIAAVVLGFPLGWFIGEALRGWWQSGADARWWRRINQPVKPLKHRKFRARREP